MGGLPNKAEAKFGFSKTAYDEEHLSGYAEADRRILENARR
jgi:hypothetical protein